MLPNTQEIAMQIAVMHELYPKDTVSQLARRLMLSPIFIINALDEGEKMELFTRGEKDSLKATSPVQYDTLMGHEFGQENVRIQNEILRVITSANDDQEDIEEGTLNLWLVGIKPSETEIAIHALHKAGYITNYELVNPKDVKTKYKFFTLKINEGKDWGRKQFVEPPKKKKSK